MVCHVICCHTCCVIRNNFGYSSSSLTLLPFFISLLWMCSASGPSCCHFYERRKFHFFYSLELV
jgi:hypothetical protein